MFDSNDPTTGEYIRPYSPSGSNMTNPSFNLSTVLVADTVRIQEFMEAIGQTVRTTPTDDISEEERLLRVKLVIEEAIEFAQAMGVAIYINDYSSIVFLEDSELQFEIDRGLELDLVEAADALSDLVVVTKGSAHTLGIPIDDITDIVMDTNMAKLDPSTGKPIRREDGKVLKPEGWEPPTEQIKARLER